ncbi:uncharacterized protein LOC126484205 [Schistocerca serialis cubense]|uniref:uncharacterized protein LOC126484205 n=1 Tax=Schistocerca serialis cubense TaxID=2023355 RepID=UPI00214E46F1|nr:uncharacterized protein LOC126484205 [Schistocerca serialis cubense]
MSARGAPSLPLLVLVLGTALWQAVPCHASSASPDSPRPSRTLSRQKRLLWVTNDGRLALPPGTSLVITPSLSLPFVRYPPDGFLSNMSISLPFTIDFDKLGLTDNQNPYGVLPPLLARSMGRMTGQLLADYLSQLLSRRRSGRSLPPPKAPPNANFHGGERALLYAAVEDFLSSFGMDGHACLLRAICEVHGHSVERFGLLGEMLKLFFTASRSPFSSVLTEYVDAERAGEEDGECWRYYKDCPKSLFQAPPNKYSKDLADKTEDEENEIQTRDTHKVTLDNPGSKFM